MKPTYEELEQQLVESHRALRAETTAHENVKMQLEKMAAENAGLKAKGREALKEAAYVYSHYNRMVDHLDGESVDGQTLHELQEVIEKGTPATDAFLAEVRANSIPDEATERDLFEEWVMEKIFISKTTLEGLRTADGYRNSTLSGTDYNGMWSQWKAIRAAKLRQEAAQ